MRCGDIFPYRIFPGIFASIDSYSKRVTTSHFRRHGRLPQWFDGFGELGIPIPVPGWSRFQFVDRETNIRLTGVPDEMLRHPKRGTWIADYKTARFTDTQDALAPMYEIQLNAYGAIASEIGMGPVYGLSLLYYEPMTEIEDADPRELIKPDGFLLKFSPKLRPVEVDVDIVHSLLRKAREIYDVSACPPGRPGCRDCSILETLLREASGAFQSIPNLR